MATIYLSAVKGDKPAADWVSQHLSAFGHEVISDVPDVQPGENVFSRLAKVVREADIIVVLLTKRSVDYEGSKE